MSVGRIGVCEQKIAFFFGILALEFSWTGREEEEVAYLVADGESIFIHPLLLLIMAGTKLNGIGRCQVLIALQWVEDGKPTFGRAEKRGKKVCT